MIGVWQSVWITLCIAGYKLLNNHGWGQELHPGKRQPDLAEEPVSAVDTDDRMRLQNQTAWCLYREFQKLLGGIIWLLMHLKRQQPQQLAHNLYWQAYLFRLNLNPSGNLSCCWYSLFSHNMSNRSPKRFLIVGEKEMLHFLCQVSYPHSTHDIPQKVQNYINAGSKHIETSESGHMTLETAEL